MTKQEARRQYNRNYMRGYAQRKGSEYREAVNATGRQRYAMRKASGMCVQCGTAAAKEGVRCAPCKAKCDEGVRRYRQSLEAA